MFKQTPSQIVPHFGSDNMDFAEHSLISRFHICTVAY